MDYFQSSLRAALALLFSGDWEVYFIVWTSLKISLAAVVLASVIAVPCGVTLGFLQFPGKRLLRQGLGTLMALPTVVVGLLLYGLLSRHGPLGDWGLLYTPTAVIIGECVLILPLMIHLVSTAVIGSDPRLLLTLKSLGANGWRRFVLIVSEIRAEVTAALVTGFGRAVGEVGVAMMVGGNIQGLTRTMTTAIALETSKGEFKLGLALGILLLAVAFVINGVLAWLQSEK